MNPYDQSGDDNRGRGGGGGRLLMALFIAVVGFIMYMVNTQQNPITGEKQRVALTPNEEIRLGIQSAPEMSSEMGGELPSDNIKTKEVINVGNHILTESRAHNGPWRFQFHVVNDPKTINAFALPGGQIFITLGLLNKLETEAQLAGILSHEMGHVIQRHAAQQMAKGQLGNILITAARVGVDSDHSNQATVVAGVVNKMLQLKYSRNDELEADQWGLILMSEAGYNPEAMLQVMEILQRESGTSHQPEMLLTHPYPENRKAQIKDYLSKHPPKPDLSNGKNLKELWN